MKVVILAGGLGSRLSEETEQKPKPMIKVGDKPILWHIMHIYAAQGFREFIIALGYKGEIIKHYFWDYHRVRHDVSIELATGKVTVYDRGAEDWIVHLVDTGIKTETGGRMKRLKNWLKDETFMLTYGDGLANIDLGLLLKKHRSHGKIATVTAVRPPSRFGGLTLDGDRVFSFIEKPQIGEGWINGGFFVFQPGILDYLPDDQTVLEKEPLEKLAAEGELFAYQHTDFWQCMDTMRDVRLLNSLWQAGSAPWKIW
ncbi:glucose-1-phosphate cytidylyltransferase [candidate division KSB1 bacterium]|nr:glucose-1-phosphate cytidylyltransferase [candidate division KSB1 bacterium]